MLEEAVGRLTFLWVQGLETWLMVSVIVERLMRRCVWRLMEILGMER